MRHKARLPFRLTLLFGLFYLSCAYLFAPENVPGLPNLLFFELIRPGDNNAPMAFAHAVYKGIATASATAEWSLSDRPPLQAGFELFFTPLRGLFGNDDAHQAVGALLRPPSRDDFKGRTSCWTACICN